MSDPEENPPEGNGEKETKEKEHNRKYKEVVNRRQKSQEDDTLGWGESQEGEGGEEMEERREEKEEGEEESEEEGEGEKEEAEAVLEAAEEEAAGGQEEAAVELQGSATLAASPEKVVTTPQNNLLGTFLVSGDHSALLLSLGHDLGAEGRPGPWDDKANIFVTGPKDK